MAKEQKLILTITEHGDQYKAELSFDPALKGKKEFDKMSESERKMQNSIAQIGSEVMKIINND